jgi:hypothetical protein
MHVRASHFPPPDHECVSTVRYTITIIIIKVLLILWNTALGRWGRCQYNLRGARPDGQVPRVVSVASVQRKGQGRVLPTSPGLWS